MNHDRTEQLIREAFADEAARRVDPREVLAGVRGRRSQRRYGLVLATAAVVVVAAVAAFVVPEVFLRSTPVPVGDQQQTQQAVTPVNVLVIGTDRNGNTDSLVLVRLGADGSASAASLPRDAWVSAGGTMTRLNQVNSQSGTDVLLTTVSELTGVPVDHHITVDMAVVADLANAVGGVPVCLNHAVSDSFSGAEFPAGEQVIEGEAALAFVRQRHGLPNGDLDRIARLQAVLRSVVDKLPEADLGALVTAVQGHVRTDPGLDLLGFATGLAEATSVHVGTIPITGESPLSEQGFVLEVDPAQVRQFVTDLPTTPPADTLPCVN